MSSNTRFTKLSALVLCALLVLSLSGVAFADNFTTVSGTATVTQAVNVRTGPGNSYTVIGYLNRGDRVTMTGYVDSGWYQIGYGSQYAYVPATSLSGSIYGSQYYGYTCTTDECYRTTSSLNIRNGPGTEYDVLGTLAKGTHISKIGQSGKWFQIYLVNGGHGYVSSKYLVKCSTGLPAYSVDVDTYASSGVYYSTAELNVRSGPGTNYSIIGSLTRGQSVTRIAKSGSWYKIQYAGGVGYAHSKYLSAAPVSSSYYAPGYAPSPVLRVRVVTPTYVYSGAGTNYSILLTANRGDVFNYSSTYGSWTRIQLAPGSSSFGYIYSNFVTPTTEACTYYASGSGGVTSTYYNGGSTTPTRGGYSYYDDLFKPGSWKNVSGTQTRYISAGTYVYAEPNSSSTAYSIPKNAPVQLMKTSPSGWCEIRTMDTGFDWSGSGAQPYYTYYITSSFLKK